MSDGVPGRESNPETNSRKIAIIGSAPSSLNLAPYGDTSWEIWGCSPGAAAHAKRVTMWFEIHPLSRPDITPDYLKWLADINVPVALIRTDPRIPKGFVYPREAMEQEFGPYFFTSSVAWILALAISQNPAEIGLWGIDMAATEEYAYQRPGCQFFIREALKRGIKVYVPNESDLHRPSVPYGFIMDSPMYVKLEQRKKELLARQADATQRYEAARNEFNFVSGALDDLKYLIDTWMQ